LTPWFNKYCDFLNQQMDPQNVLECMYDLSRILKGLLSKYYDKDTITVVIAEALKFCVPTLVTQRRSE